LETHVLSDFEKMELLFKLPGLGARKPSQMLSAMLEVTPANEEKSKLFMFMFLQRLPKDLRLMLGDVEAGDPRAVAAKADRLWACHSKQQLENVVAVVAEDQKEEEECTVAAIGGKKQQQTKQHGQWQKQKKKGQKQHQRQDGRADGNRAAKDAPMDVAIAASGLCRAHWFQGESARGCTNGMSCTWQEN